MLDSSEKKYDELSSNGDETWLHQERRRIYFCLDSRSVLEMFLFFDCFT